MGLTTVRPYFKARMESLGYREWKDNFNFENIPSSQLEKVYHLATENGSGIRDNQADQEIEMPIEIRFFKKGYRYVSEAYDSSIESAQGAIKEREERQRIPIPRESHPARDRARHVAQGDHAEQ